jgi:hypothetical protein
VSGGVAGQFEQVLGGVVGADPAGDVQGLVSDRGGVEWVAGGHREAGQLGQADRPGAGVVGVDVPGRCRGESSGGFAGVVAP